MNYKRIGWFLGIVLLIEIALMLPSLLPTRQKTGSASLKRSGDPHVQLKISRNVIKNTWKQWRSSWIVNISGSWTHNLE